MKLMTYNILDGAVNTLPEIVEIVRRESPDYLTLNEANTFAHDDNKILKEFAKLTGFPYFDIALSGEFDYHVAVFSKFPLKLVKKLQPLARACLVAVIDTAFGELSIASLHLTPFSEDYRHPEIDVIIKSQKHYSHRVLMGDMNSLAKTDHYNKKLISNFNEVQLRKFTSDGQLRFDEIEKILSNGYHDSAVLRGEYHISTVPTASNTDGAHLPLRLDYIFLSDSLSSRLCSYKVIKTERTEKASDHYPVVIQLH